MQDNLQNEEDEMEGKGYLLNEQRHPSRKVEISKSLEQDVDATNETDIGGMDIEITGAVCRLRYSNLSKRNATHYAP